MIRPVKSFNPLVDQYTEMKNVVYVGHRGAGIGIRYDL